MTYHQYHSTTKILGESNLDKRSPEYAAWANMKTRCDNPNRPTWRRYGGRGIKYQKSWVRYECFLSDMGRMPRKGYTLDRINVEADYTKENCRWISRADNARQVLKGKRITLFGETKRLRQWLADPRCKCPSKNAYYARLNYGWSIKQALITPNKKE